MQDRILRLRNRENITLFDRKEKTFIRFQLNKQEPFICWKRYASKDRNNWVLWNEYLSLKDVVRSWDKLIASNKD